MIEIDSHTIAWAAGLFEGEGTIIVSKTRVRVAIHMTDLDILERFLPFGGIIYDMPKQETHHKKSWRWQLQETQGAMAFLELVYPYLGARRKARVEEARIAFSKNRHVISQRKREEVLRLARTTNLTQKQIGERVGITRERANKIINGKDYHDTRG